MANRGDNDHSQDRKRKLRVWYETSYINLDEAERRIKKNRVSYYKVEVPHLG